MGEKRACEVGYKKLIQNKVSHNNVVISFEYVYDMCELKQFCLTFHITIQNTIYIHIQEIKLRGVLFIIDSCMSHFLYASF